MVEIHAIQLLQSFDFQNKMTKFQEFFPVQSWGKILEKSAYACQASMLGELLVRKQIIRQFGIIPSNIEFSYTQQGKPYFNKIPTFHFNISHSKDWVVAAFSDKELGIDIEKVKPIKIAVAERFFSSQEFNDLSQKREQDQTPYFFDLWTAKESFVKAIGTGIANVFHTFSIQIQDGKISIVENNFPSVNFKTYSLPENHKICVCSFESDFCDKINIQTVKNLIED